MNPPLPLRTDWERPAQPGRFVREFLFRPQSSQQRTFSLADLPTARLAFAAVTWTRRHLEDRSSGNSDLEALAIDDLNPARKKGHSSAVLPRERAQKRASMGLVPRVQIDKP